MTGARPNNFDIPANIGEPTSDRCTSVPIIFSVCGNKSLICFKGVFNSEGLKKLNTGLLINLVIRFPIKGIFNCIFCVLPPIDVSINSFVNGSSFNIVENLPDWYKFCSASNISCPAGTLDPALGLNMPNTLPPINLFVA